MSGGMEKGSSATKTPADFLKSIRGRPVVVKLNSGVDYRGTSNSSLSMFYYINLFFVIKLKCIVFLLGFPSKFFYL